jgi:hypothetical protein
LIFFVALSSVLQKMFQMKDINILITSNIDEDVKFYKEGNNYQISWDEIEDELNSPCNMEYILLCSNWAKQIYRVFNVKELTNREVCNVIYRFYKHKTYRRLMGDHVWIEGWFTPKPDEPNVFMPLMYGS